MTFSTADPTHNCSPSIHPATGKEVSRHLYCSPSEMDGRLHVAATGFSAWWSSAPHNRASIFAVMASIADDKNSGIMVTGSVRAGSAIASQAFASIKKAVLALGGSDLCIVLRDGDVSKAVEAAILGRFQNTGQVCIAARRIIVHTSLLDEFATLLTGVLPGTTAFHEEVFGPVASLISLLDEDDALALAIDSDSEYGLFSSVWTEDDAAANRFASKLQTGGVLLKKLPISDPRVPIGGVKKSAYGRELSTLGIREFLDAQTVWSN